MILEYHFRNQIICFLNGIMEKTFVLVPIGHVITIFYKNLVKSKYVDSNSSFAFRVSWLLPIKTQVFKNNLKHANDVKDIRNTTHNILLFNKFCEWL